MDVNNTEFSNDIAAFGGVICSCNSDITLSDDLTSVDPLQTICILYDNIGVITATQYDIHSS